MFCPKCGKKNDDNSLFCTWCGAGFGSVSTQSLSAAPAASAPVAGSGEKVNAPMPGTVLDVKVNVGDTVSKGQVIMILEAMKMENDIVASCDGKITSVLAKKGDTVNSGDALATIG